MATEDETKPVVFIIMLENEVGKHLIHVWLASSSSMLRSNTFLL